VMRHGMMFGGETPYLSVVREMVNVVDGKVFNNKW